MQTIINSKPLLILSLDLPSDGEKSVAGVMSRPKD